MRALLLLLLLAVLIATAAAAQWTIYTQGTDPNGEWGFLNFYPQALTINPGDNVTFIQNHDAGIIVMLPDSSTAPSPFYQPQPAACLGKCVALTPYSVPNQAASGPLSNATARFTHINNLQGPFSAGFLGTAGEVPSFIPDRWTFYFDPAILGTGTSEVAVRFWEVLHSMSIQIKINPSPGAIVKTPAEIDTAAKAQIQTDAGLVPTIFQSTVVPVNGIIYNNELCAWVVHTGAQVTSSPTNNGYGIGSFDRFLPFDTNLRKSNIDINEGDSINFLQITPHGHAVSIYSLAHPFNDSEPSYDPVVNSLVEPITHFVPSPTPDSRGVIHFDGTQAVTGPLIVPGQNATVKFDCAPGTYYYFCVFHQTVNMEGTITVKAKGSVSYPSGTPSKCKAAASTTSFAPAVYPIAVLVSLLVAMLL